MRVVTRGSGTVMCPEGSGSFLCGTLLDSALHIFSFAAALYPFPVINVTGHNCFQWVLWAFLANYCTWGRFGNPKLAVLRRLGQSWLPGELCWNLTVWQLQVAPQEVIVPGHQVMQNTCLISLALFYFSSLFPCHPFYFSSLFLCPSFFIDPSLILSITPMSLRPRQQWHFTMKRSLIKRLLWNVCTWSLGHQKQAKCLEITYGESLILQAIIKNENLV